MVDEDEKIMGRGTRVKLRKNILLYHSGCLDTMEVMVEKGSEGVIQSITPFVVRLDAGVYGSSTAELNLGEGFDIYGGFEIVKNRPNLRIVR